MKHNTMAIVRTRIIFSLLTIMTIMFSMGKDLMAQTTASIAVKNIVLVHGGFVDGSGWAGVYKALKKNGYDVTIVQNSTTSLADDVATTKRALAMQNGPVILVGHSYGGAVITEAGNDPKVAGLVYIAAFAPDRGESVSSLIKDAPPGAPVPPIMPPVDGYLLLDKAKFPASFAVGSTSANVVSPNIRCRHFGIHRDSGESEDISRISPRICSEVLLTFCLSGCGGANVQFHQA
jgi:pimeloyl-ACP methyl ester carboxylesterase